MFKIIWTDSNEHSEVVTKHCKTVSELKESIAILNHSSVAELLKIDFILINSADQLIYIERR